MASIKVSVAVISLLTVWLLATHTSAGSYNCCRQYTRGKIPFNKIKGYAVQTDTESCPLKAIIFLTESNRRVCTNPALNWVMDYINRIRNKAQQVHKMAQTHT
ncbi:C-C motif chemokine 20a.3 [Parambassis ranga]|uniref:C-C motif chemokine n=1 Tax=Parambassis ranga TaxID=210632 RepID=A0A6P7K3I5_9TELE|nr:C-C motif chemokine 4 homolog [Parambassis ranga]